MPPATTTERFWLPPKPPSIMPWLASVIALRPEAQTLLMVVASDDWGMPEARRTCRAGDWPAPAWMTCKVGGQRKGGERSVV
jgi:hypothetical protein